MARVLQDVLSPHPYPKLECLTLALILALPLAPIGMPRLGPFRAGKHCLEVIFKLRCQCPQLVIGLELRGLQARQ